MKKKPYAERSDEEKVFDNWTKTLGLLEREEYSVAVVRAAVSAELAANLAVRAELVQQRNLDSIFVDHLLVWANGLRGKFEKLLLPITKTSNRHSTVLTQHKRLKRVNDERNSVAHSGQFKNKRIANEVVSKTRLAIIDLVQLYSPKFTLGTTQSEQFAFRKGGTICSKP